MFGVLLFGAAFGGWPEDPTLRPLSMEVPACFGRPTVMISAGHGAPDNHGNTGVWGQREEDVTLALADDLAERLSPHVDVVLARSGDERPTYDARIAKLHASGADWLVELHTDWRVGTTPWAESPFGPVYRTEGAAGFSVLYRHQGPLAEGRQTLARSLARQLLAIGLPAYDGRDYMAVYDRDTEVDGVFLDLRGLRMLWKPRVPSAIIEVHHASDPVETLHWRTEPVRAAFATAVLAGLVDARGCP